MSDTRFRGQQRFRSLPLFPRMTGPADDFPLKMAIFASLGLCMLR
jgi:hypothetical protein